MKKIGLVLVIALMMFSMTPPHPVWAAGPAGNWVSGIACQNMDNTQAATILISFYAEGNGTAVFTYNDTIPAGGSKGYYTPNVTGLPTPLVGSAVVSSSTEIVCNVNTQTSSAGTETSPYRIGTSSGFSESQTAATIYAPQLEKAFYNWNSYLSIQNTGSASVTVDITYRDRNGVLIAAANEAYTIPAQTNKVVYQESNPNLPAGFLGSAKIAARDGTTKLAVVASFYNNASSSGTSQFHSYNGMSTGGEKLFVPYIVRNYYGYNGGISIQNVGTTNTAVTITFTFGTTNYVYTFGTIAPGSALALYTPNMPELNAVDALPLGQHAGSAVIQADSGAQIVAIVNQSNLGGAGVPVERVGQGATYNAILDGTQTVKVFLPQVPKRAGGIFSGGFQITNTTAAAGTCTITYAGVPSATETNVALFASGVISRYAPSNANLTVGFNGSVSVVCTQPVVAIVNLAADPGTGKVGDSFTQSNTVNTP